MSFAEELIHLRDGPVPDWFRAAVPLSGIHDGMECRDYLMKQPRARRVAVAGAIVAVEFATVVCGQTDTQLNAHFWSVIFDGGAFLRDWLSTDGGRSPAEAVAPRLQPLDELLDGFHPAKHETHSREVWIGHAITAELAAAVRGTARPPAEAIGHICYPLHEIATIYSWHESGDEHSQVHTFFDRWLARLPG